MRVTLQTIADATGADRGTVSRVLNGQARRYKISQERSEAIQQTARRLGYRPNQLGRALRSGRNCDVGLLVGGDENDWLPDRLMSGLQAALGALDYTLRIGHLDLQAREPARLWRDLLRHDMIDGLLVAVRRAVPGATALRAELRGWGRPVVWLTDQSADHVVPVDTSGDAARATGLLLERGHRRILYAGLLAAPPTGYVDERLSGYRSAMQAAGAQPEALSIPDVAALQAALTARLGQADAPTAVLCRNDDVALLSQVAAATNGLAVPAGLALLSLSPPKTVASAWMSRYALDERERGRESVHLLRTLIQTPDADFAPACLTASLTHSATIGPPRPGA